MHKRCPQHWWLNDANVLSQGFLRIPDTDLLGSLLRSHEAEIRCYKGCNLIWNSAFSSKPNQIFQGLQSMDIVKLQNLFSFWVFGLFSALRGHLHSSPLGSMTKWQLNFSKSLCDSTALCHYCHQGSDYLSIFIDTSHIQGRPLKSLLPQIVHLLTFNIVISMLFI
jgi:hypothetical protein